MPFPDHRLAHLPQSLDDKVVINLSGVKRNVQYIGTDHFHAALVFVAPEDAFYNVRAADQSAVFFQ